MEKRELVKKDYLQGVKPKKLASTHDISVNTIKSWIRRYGWKSERDKVEEGCT